MNIHMSKRLLVAAAVLGALAVFATAFFVAPTLRSVVAGPSASPDAPNPGHAWSEIEDHGIDGAGQWLGTTVDQALELRVNGSRGLRLEPDATSPNLIGGYSDNDVTDGVVGATIGGGGASGYTNRVTDDYGTVGGGRNNLAGDDGGAVDLAAYATVGGGQSNTASYWCATVGGGHTNTAGQAYATVGGGYNNSASQAYATVGGGRDNLASTIYAAVGGGSYNAAGGDYATVGGGQGNTADGWAATIAGGGRSNPEDPATGNRVTDEYGTVGGGGNNQAGDNAGTTSDATYATVGGGYNNEASKYYATVSGGTTNDASGTYATVGGGVSNHASGDHASVGGGYNNTASQTYATVGGGVSNTASDDCASVGGGDRNTASGDYATVSGGQNNEAIIDKATVGGGQNNTASGDWATVGGGYSNEANQTSATVAGGYDNTASAGYASVGGGYDNTASNYSATVAGGWSNEASEEYATVGGGYDNTASGTWAAVGGGRSNTASGLYATVPGGHGNTAQGALSFAAGQRAKANNQGCFVWSDSTDADFTCSTNDRFQVRADGGVYLYSKGDLSTGVYMNNGDNDWTGVSDRNLKENFTPVDGQEVLASLAEIPITTWNLKGQDASIQHMGPVAQDFYAAFGLGYDELHITGTDPDGVALAAIQGLYELSQEQAERIDTLEARVAALEGGDPVNPGSESLLSSVMPFGPLLLAGLFVGGLALVHRRRAGGRR
jgi:hypothetical protein